jgi:hypothetical protein
MNRHAAEYMSETSHLGLDEQIGYCRRVDAGYERNHNGEGSSPEWRRPQDWPMCDGLTLSGI